MHLITMRALAEAAVRFPQYKTELLSLGKVIKEREFPHTGSAEKGLPFAG